MRRERLLEYRDGAVGRDFADGDAAVGECGRKDGSVLRLETDGKHQHSGIVSTCDSVWAVDCERLGVQAPRNDRARRLRREEQPRVSLADLDVKNGRARGSRATSQGDGRARVCWIKPVEINAACRVLRRLLQLVGAEHQERGVNGMDLQRTRRQLCNGACDNLCVSHFVGSFRGIPLWLESEIVGFNIAPLTRSKDLKTQKKFFFFFFFVLSLGPHRVRGSRQPVVRSQLALN